MQGRINSLIRHMYTDVNVHTMIYFRGDMNIDIIHTYLWVIKELIHILWQSELPLLLFFTFYKYVITPDLIGDRCYVVTRVCLCVSVRLRVTKITREQNLRFAQNLVHVCMAQPGTLEFDLDPICPLGALQLINIIWEGNLLPAPNWVRACRMRQGTWAFHLDPIHPLGMGQILYSLHQHVADHFKQASWIWSVHTQWLISLIRRAHSFQTWCEGPCTSSPCYSMLKTICVIRPLAGRWSAGPVVGTRGVPFSSYW